jgi:hypothetical protein
MGLEMLPAEAGPAAAAAAAGERSRERQQPVVEIHPLCRYYFGTKDPRSDGAAAETAADRTLRLKAK